MAEILEPVRFPAGTPVPAATAKLWSVLNARHVAALAAWAARDAAPLSGTVEAPALPAQDVGASAAPLAAPRRTIRHAA